MLIQCPFTLINKLWLGKIVCVAKHRGTSNNTVIVHKIKELSLQCILKVQREWQTVQTQGAV